VDIIGPRPNDRQHAGRPLFTLRAALASLAAFALRASLATLTSRAGFATLPALTGRPLLATFAARARLTGRWRVRGEVARDRIGDLHIVNRRRVNAVAAVPAVAQFRQPRRNQRINPRRRLGPYLGDPRIVAGAQFSQFRAVPRFICATAFLGQFAFTPPFAPLVR
jgi:hypothetical protein